MKQKLIVDDISKMPAGEHWAILQNESIHVPGDERSRTAPGHGYPEHTEKSLSYTAYFTFEEFENELKKAYLAQRQGFGHSVIGIHVTGAYTHKVEIVLSKPQVMRGGPSGSTFTES